jgi:hypothetical protein
MKKRSIAALTLLGLISSISPSLCRETTPILNVENNKLNSDRCKEDFAGCSKISEAANVSFDGVYPRDAKDGKPEESEAQWRNRLKNDLKQPGAGWDKGYTNVQVVDTGKDYDAQFVIAEKRVKIGVIKDDNGTKKNEYKTYYLIGIRGTHGFSDVTTDLDGRSSEYSNGLTVHNGFLGYAKAIEKTDSYKKLIDKIRTSQAKEETYEVLVTGHSLGGAAATLVKANLEENLPASASQISAITFGAPPVGNKEFADRYGNNVTALIADGDFVPTAGLNAYRVGSEVKFEHPNETEKRKQGTTRNVLDWYLDYYNAKNHVTDWHMTYSQRERYDSSVQNGWYDLRNELMQQNLTSITLGGSSHIGSASYYLGRSSNKDPRIELDGVKIKSLQEREQYITAAGSITNLKAPVDIVLNWNQSVAKGQLDLDSHLTAPAGLGDDSSVRAHTYFSSKGSIDTAPYVLLYRDVIPAGGGSGAEQTRIQVLQNGVYRFYVHDYTNRDTTTSTALSQSGANVKVYNFGQNLPTEGQNLGTQLGNTINVPTNQQGNVWRAFELDSRTGVLKPVNAPFGNVSAPASVPSIGESSVINGGVGGK